MTRLRRALAGLALVRARLRPDLVPLLLVAVLVALTAGLAAALPRLFAASADAALRHAAATAHSLSRNLEFAQDGHLSPLPGDPLGAIAAEGAELRAQLPPSVAELVVTQTDGFEASEQLVADAPDRVPITQLTLAHQVGIDELITYVEGRPPTGTTERVTLEDRLDPAEVPFEAIAYEAAVSTATFDMLRLEIGDRLLIAPQPEQGGFGGVGNANLGYSLVDIVGRYDVRDPDDPRWFDDSSLQVPNVEPISIELVIYHATALVAADAYATLGGPQPASSTVDLDLPFRYLWRFTVDPARLDSAGIDGFLDELARLRAAFPFAGVTFGSGAPSLQTDLDGVGARYLAQRRTAEGVLLTAALGPAGAGAGAVLLVALLVLRRRRTAIALVRGRGASSVQVLGGQLAEALLVALPAALAGAGVAALLVPGGSSAADGAGLREALGIGVLVALGAVAAFAIAAWPLARAANLPTTERPPTRPTLGRLVGEVALVVLAAIAVTTLLGRGLRSTDAERVVDPLLAAAPSLVALAGAVVLLRLAPVPIAGLARVAARGRGLVGALATRTATRQPFASSVPLVVVVLATSLAAFGAVVLGSLDRAQARASWLEVGADVRVDTLGGQSVPPNLWDGLPDAERPAAVAEVASLTATLRGESVRPIRATLVAVGVAEHAAVVAGSPIDDVSFDALRVDDLAGIGSAERPLPAFVSSDLVERGDAAPGSVLLLAASGRDVVIRVVGVLDGVPGLVDQPRQLVLPLDGMRAALPERTLPAEQLLVRLGPATEDAVDAAAAADATVLDVEHRSTRAAALAGAPLVTTIRGGIALALGIAILYAALALAAGLVLAVAARRRQLTILRTLGLARADVGRLVVLEHLPLVLLAVVGGLGLGAAAGVLLVPALGLTAFTGSAGTGTGLTIAPVDVPVVLDPFVTLALGLPPLVAAVLVVGLGAVAVVRSDAARAVRVGG